MYILMSLICHFFNWLGGLAVWVYKAHLSGKQAVREVLHINQLHDSTWINKNTKRYKLHIKIL